MAENSIHTDLTPNEQAEVDAAAEEAKGGKTTEEAAAETAKAAGAAEGDADKGAGEEKIDPAAKAQQDIAKAMTDATNRLADALTPRKDETTTTTVAAEPDWAKERADARSKFDVVRTEFESVRAKVSAGELDDDALESAQRKLDTAEDAYERDRETILERRTEFLADAKATARINESRTADLNTRWTQEWTGFAAEASNKEFLSDATRQAAYQVVLNAVAAESPNMPFRQMMETARDRTLAAFGVKVDGAAAAEAAIKKAEEERLKKAGVIPKSIANAPNAGRTTEIPTAEAQLDALDIDDLENTLAKMKPEAVEAYLANAPGGLRDNPRGG